MISKYKIAISIFIIWLFNISGILGILSSYSEWFLKLTPINLSMYVVLIIWSVKDVSKKFLLAFFIPFFIGFTTEYLGVNYGLIFGSYYWDSIIKDVRKDVLNRLSDSLSVNLEELIEFETILDPRLIESNTKSYQGALYGASSNNKFAAFLRHPNFSQNISNLYFCGGSVHPGGGIPLCLLSGKIVSELILKQV